MSGASAILSCIARSICLSIISGENESSSDIRIHYAIRQGNKIKVWLVA